jgi:hypothetical protein
VGGGLRGMRCGFGALGRGRGGFWLRCGMFFFFCRLLKVVGVFGWAWVQKGCG